MVEFFHRDLPCGHPSAQEKCSGATSLISSGILAGQLEEGVAAREYGCRFADERRLDECAYN